MIETPPSTPRDPASRETPKERVDRETSELLQGLRVATTGVQVLFAFLLTVPFSQGFRGVDDLERWTLYTALVAAAVASVCFIAPAAQHRVLFRSGAKELLLRRSNQFGILGAAALTVAITSATFFVVRAFLDSWLPAVTAGAVAALALWAWLIQPLITLFSLPKSERYPSATADPADVPGTAGARPSGTADAGQGAGRTGSGEGGSGRTGAGEAGSGRTTEGDQGSSPARASRS
ncbi:DUF6328 family protein [Bailinhaonella thermotolerans]|uniref:DUF6328 family protein n=1 Tax=Bailinhaonella thermotolerans TaxID=1070861 RepID=UPI00192A5F09|nr:DUF6328 family protein [Bailinhaonella thermotolerans]